METIFFTGNYTLGIGHPYVILTTDQDAVKFHSEKIIIFEGFNGQTSFLAYRTNYPKLSGRTIEDFISNEIQTCKDDILHKILFAKYEQQLQAINYNVKIELIETNANILAFLRDKFPAVLNNIKSRTINDKLKSQIEIYQSIVVERDDFDIER